MQSGKLELTVKATHGDAEPKTYTVTGDHIIDIPPYHIYSIKVLEDTALYNYGGAHDLMACLEDLASVQKNHPEQLGDKEAYHSFLRRYGVYATNLEYKQD